MEGWTLLDDFVAHCRAAERKNEAVDVFGPWSGPPFIPPRTRNPRGWQFLLETLATTSEEMHVAVLEAFVDKELVTREEALEIYWG